MYFNILIFSKKPEKILLYHSEKTVDYPCSDGIYVV